MRTLFAIFLLFPLLALAATGDIFFISRDGVPLRAGPGPDYEVAMSLKRDQKVVELERSGAWVKVGVFDTRGEDGWVRASVLSKSMIAPPPPPPPDPSFETFKERVWAFNEEIRKVAVRGLYRRVENLGEGEVRLTVSNAWLRQTHEERKANLKFLLNLWSDARGKDAYAKVELVDARGNLIMTMKKNDS